GGNIAVHGDVTGGGSATISSVATLEFGGASDVNTIFAAAGDGTLKLDHSSGFTGTVSGFNAGDSLDLADILFDNVPSPEITSAAHHAPGTTLSFSANDAGTGGTLSVTDGVHTAQISLQGQYVATHFQIASDGGGGTVVTYNDPSLPPELIS